MKQADFRFRASSGIDIYVHGWVPDGPVRGVVQVSHGMQEHGARYAPVAEALSVAGFAVYAGDHRGHGLTAEDPTRLGHLGPGGFKTVICDLKQVSDQVRERHPDVPLFLVGHSWGSFLGQAYAQKWGRDLKGLVLSGTNGKDPLSRVGEIAARAIARLDGMDTTATLLEKLTMGNFNDDFKPGTTGKEWLSREPAEVRKYVDDPLCGRPFPNRFFVELLALLNATWKTEEEARIPKELPVFLIAGSEDPVGKKGKGVLALAERYRKQGIKDVTWRLYQGARHEIFNETNRSEVLQDLLDWLEAHR